LPATLFIRVFWNTTAFRLHCEDGSRIGLPLL
jgi:hypothetical protein